MCVFSNKWEYWINTILVRSLLDFVFFLGLTWTECTLVERFSRMLMWKRIKFNACNTIHLLNAIETNCPETEIQLEKIHANPRFRFEIVLSSCSSENVQFIPLNLLCETFITEFASIKNTMDGSKIPKNDHDSKNDIY